MTFRPPTIAERATAWRIYDAAVKRWNDTAQAARRWSPDELSELGEPGFPRPREDELAAPAAPAAKAATGARYRAALLGTIRNHKEGIERLAARVDAIEQRTAAAEFSRAQAAAISGVEQARAAALTRLAEGDDDVHGYRN